MAACHWEMVVTSHRGKAFLTVRGPETKATTADCPAEGEWLAIRFKLCTFMPLLPARNLSDRKYVTTNVTWAMRGPMPYMSKLMSIFFNMDRMIGKDFEDGLANLKRTTEK
jgi:hypothetical protein